MTHEHKEEHGSLRLVTLAVSGLLFAMALFFLQGKIRFVAFAASYLLSAWSVIREAAENMVHGEIFDENFLMTVASIGAFCIGEYPEAVAVMLLYQVGEWLQDKAVDSSRDSIQALIAVRPDRATLLNGEEVNAADVAVGTRILVRPGERIPLDGIVREGSASVDTTALTGESLPRQCSAGEKALSGCVVLDGVLTVEVTKPYADSTVSRIMELVEEAQANKAQPEQFITRFARIYTPVVCGIALLLAVLPPLFGFGTLAQYLHKALTVLVISCPCALVISVPLAFFSGIGCASHHGILFKGGSYLELLATANVAAFDKTGTLTEGCFRVTEILPAAGYTECQVLETAAYAESQSTHPLAKAIVAAYEKTIDLSRIREVQEISGQGIRAKFDGKEVLAGKRDFAAQNQALTDDTAVYISADGAFLGCILLEDTIKSDAKEAIEGLRRLGLSHFTILSGDQPAAAERISGEIGLDQVYAGLLPLDKVKKLKELKAYGNILYAGDGINDAPVLACADIGIAMGGLGSDAAMEAADVVITSDEPSRIPQAIRIARKTMKIAKENIVFSIAVKCIILTVSLIETVPLWLAVFADVGVCFIAILNSLRVMYAYR